MGKTATPLPHTRFNWVGGDAPGLSALAQILYDFSPQAVDVAKTLTMVVDRLVSEGGTSWTGRAASNFRSSFGRDSQDIYWHSGIATGIADVVDRLAVQLATLESSVEAQAEADAAGGLIALAGNGTFKGTAADKPNNLGKTAVDQLNDAISEAKKQAMTARKDAAGKLDALYKQLAGGLASYFNNRAPMAADPGGLLSADQLDAIKSEMDKLSASYGKLHPSAPKLSDQTKSRMKDAINTDTTIIGAVAGGIVGTLIEPGGGTVVGAGLGGLAGQAAGSLVGSIFD